ncbi:hypothetical protein P2318_27605 [Myxococcaceae bacterium GXIMD 01537]
MRGLKFKKSLAALSLFTLASCSGDMSEGRLVGFVVDGQTGQRVNLFKADEAKQNVEDDAESKSQVYAVIDGEFRRAKPCGEGDLTQENAIEADGCFQIDGIPLGMEIPVFAKAPGYERFIGRYTYQLHDEDTKGYQRIANIRMFPVGFAVDYKFQVNFQGRPVPGVNVVCQYRQSQANNLAVDGIFLQPENSGSTGVSAQTGADGVAVIPGAQLVNGANYHCEAVANQQVDGRVLSGERDIVAGVAQAEQRMALTANGSLDNGLYAVNSNADNPAELLGANGKLIISFNKPVQLLPRVVDCHNASLFTSDYDADGNTGSMPANIPGNNASETVLTELSADGLTLTLTPRFERALDADDRGTSIGFSGVYVQPRNATDGAQVRYIGGACAMGEIYPDSDELQNVRTNGTQSAFIRLF